MGDVTGNGEIDLVMPVQCTKDIAGGGTTDRLVAVNTSAISTTGKVAARWLSPRLSQPHPGAYEPPAGSALPNPPAYPGSVGGAYRSLPTLARITPTGGTKILLRKLWSSTEGYYFATPALGTYTYAACRTVTGLVADEGRACKATYVLNAGTGVVENVLTAPNNADEQQIDNGPTTSSPPIVADLDGDGQVEIISGGDVWKLVNGNWTLAWQAPFESNAGIPKAYEPDSVAVADLDGDGKAEVIMHMLPTSNSGVQIFGWIYIFSHDGTPQRKIPMENGLPGIVSVADVDGDGTSEILLTFSGVLYVYRGDGSLLWAKELSDDVTVVTPVINQLQPALRSNNSPVYVYDLDLDGVPEVIVQGSRRLFILNGRTGAEIWSVDTEADGYRNNATPMLVDADGDGHVDIVLNNRSRWNCSVLTGGPVDCKGGTFKISGGDLNWAPGPRVQNQMNFRASAINDSAVIRYDASMRRDFRQQIQQGTVIDQRVSQGTSFTYKANDGTLDSAPATVQVDIKPVNRPPVITSIPPTAFTETAPTGTFQTVYTITAVDPDPGDSVHYEFVATQGRQFAPPTVDPVTGAVNVTVCGAACGGRLVTIVVAAIDSFGARTEQSMIINMTPTTATVPNVVGQTIVAARALLEPVPLTPLVASEVFNSAAAGIVLAQDPLAGASGIAQNATVRLTVSKGPKPTLVPFVVGDTLSVANAKLVALGFSRAVAPVFSTTIPVNQVMSQTPNGGTELLPIPANPVSLTVSAGPPLPLPIASIVVEPGPGPLQRLAGDELQFKATAVFTDGTSADITLTSAWASTAASAATVSTTGLAKAIGNGTTTISATLGGRTGSVTLNVAARTLGDNTPPAAAITAPTDGAAITGPTTIVGTATDTNFLRYELAIALAGDETFSVIAEGTTAVNNGTLGTLDPTTMVNDLYTIRLTVFDRSENVTVVTSTVQLKGNRKVGLFTLTYQDLNVPAAGIPLTVHRTYDSRDKMKGDFGIGWRLGLQTLRIRTNRALGTGWVRNVAGINVSLAPTSGHWVSVTLPDGRVEEFDMVVSPTSNGGSLDATNVTGFTPRAGTLGRLEALGNNSLLIISGGATFELVDDTTLNTYSPKLYRYTTQDGTQIEISPAAGVKKVTDRNGNAVTFGPGGILHSDGRGIVFKRDAKDRIVSITDLMGNVQNYTYDGNGDLVTHTNAVGAVSTFSYDRNHGLIEIRNALGVRAARNDYDASGRLISMTDADGKQITITHDMASNEEVVTDRLGNSSRVLYDASGNVLSSQKSVTIAGVLVNATTTMTYDAQGNETSVTDPDGLKQTSTYAGVLPITQVVDPTGLNLSTSFAYNPRNDVTNATDAGGRAFNFSYDANGNLTSFDSPLAGASSSPAGPLGLPSQRIDALGNKTNLTYDSAGRVTREEVVDAASTLLRRMDFAYDTNGNKTSATLFRTIGGTLTPLVTRYDYDAANRLIATTDPLGGISRTEYDANARVTATVDPLGRRTTYTYDTLGRLSRTTFPDGTFESSTLDPDGTVIASTDRAGRTTTFAYDELKRLVKTTLPNGSFTQTIYSAGGRVDATIDANGNRTDYAYDTAGRRTTTTLPAVANGTSASPLVRPSMTTSLNPLGTPVSATDANGQVTTFQYDVSGRPSQTTYPDGSTTRQTFDALGRRTSNTNEEGQTTNYSYDGLGRLIAVSGLAGDATYTYDEGGNMLTQSDALGRVTRFRYDALGRMVEKTYPGGETERLAFDAVGNIVARVDGLSRTTLFTYNSMSRVITKILPGGSTVATTYNADGQRVSVTDARGVTRYTYDAIGRLASVIHPTSETVTYTRDANGNLMSLTSPAATVNYSYDALNRLSQVTSPEGQSRTYYDLVGNRIRQTAANGMVTDTSFSNRNRPTLLTHTNATGTILQSYATVYSLAGRRTRITELDGSVENYTYDARGRLATETRTGTNPLVHTHTYDAVGNRVQAVRGGVSTTYSYNSNDQLLSDGVAAYTWDANGNLGTKIQSATATAYGFDAENRLRSVNGGGLANTYAYDADGNRVQASTAGGSLRFLIDGANNTGLSQVLEEKDGNGTLNARYSYGAEMLAMARGAVTSFQMKDPLGSIRALANATGTPTDQYQYDAYGAPVSSTGSTVNHHRYRGERFDADTGLYQLRARYYSPEQGRFNSRDPFSGRMDAPVSRHRYLYADADPVNRMDPTGQTTLTELSFVQGMQSMLNASYGAQVVVQFCNVTTQLDQAKAALWAVDNLGTAAVAGVAGYAALQAAAYGSFAPTLALGWESTELTGKKGLKKIGVGVTGGGGALAIGFNFDLHTSPPSAVKFDFGLLPTVSLAPGFAISNDKLKKEFTYCSTLVVGSVAVKGELGAGATFDVAGTGGSSGASLGIEASLFRGAVKFGIPLLKITFPPAFSVGSILTGF
ncbi:MAG: PASTA domain-containing protein [Betaproteobacteria bacterium]|nr:PASTA domain-containing protein [Betaproteobacteria bacterium]